MKKIGTISSAFGLIFFGVWLLLKTMDPYWASKILDFWPVIFITLGIEIIYYYKKKKENEKIGFDFLFLMVVLIFVGVNIYIGFRSKFNSFNFNNKGYRIDMFNKYESKYDSVNIDKSFVLSNKNILISTNNANLMIKKSTDDKLRLVGNIYCENKGDLNLDDIYKNGTINLEDSEIKELKCILYVPKGVLIETDTDNLRLEADDKEAELSYKIKSNNGAVSLNSISPKMQINIDNGTINVKNDKTEDVKISLENGTVNYATRNLNLNVDISIDTGICNFNGETGINSAVKKITNDNNLSLVIKAEHGTINVKSLE